MSGIEEERSATVVAIASSNYLMRLGLQQIMEVEKWIRLIGPAANETLLDEMLIHEQPHIVIVDTEVASDVTGFIRKIKIAAPRIRIILLTGLHDPECTRQAIDFGVDGIVLKVQPSAVLLATIEHLARSDREYLQPVRNEAAQLTLSKALSVPATLTRNPYQGKWPEGLTEREREVIRLVGQGLTNKDIADRLCLSSITVRHHLTNIFDKLGVSSRQKLLIRAHQFGIVELTAQA